MNENLKQMIDLCNSYVNGDIGFNEFEQEYDNVLFSCEYSEAVAEILDDLQYDIAITVRGELTEQEKKDYISDKQLRENITNYLNQVKYIANH